MIDYFMPSEIARLVLGYLKNVNCKNTVSMFLQECIHIKEYYECLQHGKEYSTNIGGKSLTDILNEYCALKSTSSENISQDAHQIIDKLQNLLMQPLLKQPNLNQIQNASLNSLTSGHHALLQKKQTRCAVVTAQRQCIVKEQDINALEKGVNNEFIEKNSFSPTEAGGGFNSQHIDSQTKDSIPYQERGKELFSSVNPQTTQSAYYSINPSPFKNDPRTWKSVASSPIDFEDFIYKKTPKKISSECMQSFSLYSLPPKDETPQKNIFSEDSNFRSPRRKSQLPKKKSNGSTTPQSMKKRGNPVNELDGIDFQNEESLSFLLEHVMSNTALHERLAENINKVVNVPPTLPETVKETPLPNTTVTSIPPTEELQDLHVTESVIKDIINRTESDPVFEELLSCMFDNGKSESNASSFDISAPLTPLLTENAELFNKASQEMMERMDNENLQAEAEKNQQEPNLNPVQNSSLSFHNISNHNLGPLSVEKYHSPVISPSVTEPSAYVEVGTSYTPIGNAKTKNVCSYTPQASNVIVEETHSRDKLDSPSNRGQEFQNVSVHHSENSNHSSIREDCSSMLTVNENEPANLNLVSQNNVKTVEVCTNLPENVKAQDALQKATTPLSALQDKNKAGENANNELVCSSSIVGSQAENKVDNSTENDGAEANGMPTNTTKVVLDQTGRRTPVIFHSLPQEGFSNPVILTSTSEAIANMQLLTFSPGSRKLPVFANAVTVTPNSNVDNNSPNKNNNNNNNNTTNTNNRFIIINYNSDQNSVQRLQNLQHCRTVKAKPTRRTILKQSNGSRVDHHAVRSLNFHSELQSGGVMRTEVQEVTFKKNKKLASNDVNSEVRIPLEQAMDELINVTVNPEASTQKVEFISSSILKSTSSVRRQANQSINIVAASENSRNDIKTSPQLKTLVSSIQKICKPVQNPRHVRVLDFGTPVKAMLDLSPVTAAGSQSDADKRSSTKRKERSTDSEILSPPTERPRNKDSSPFSNSLPSILSKRPRRNAKSKSSPEQSPTISLAKNCDKDKNEKQRESKTSSTEKKTSQKSPQDPGTKKILHDMDVEKFLSNLHYIE